MISLSIQFPEDEFEVLKEHFATSDIALTQQHIAIKDALENSVLTKDEVDNLYNYLNKKVIPEHRVVKALLSSCLQATERKILTPD